MTHWLRNFILMALMLAASGMAVALRPTQRIADQGPNVDLESMIPHAFSEWREEKQSSTQIVDPQQQATLDRIYSQLLSRTYVNNKGYRIMLSIAYGKDQSKSMQVHKPEICYPAQGFVLEKKQAGVLALNKGSIPVTRILTSMGQRIEPVTYWMTIADQVAKSDTSKRFIQLSYALTGNIPDGMLIRVSSIDPQVNNAYEIQNQFSAQMLESMSPKDRLRLTGNLELN